MTSPVRLAGAPHDHQEISVTDLQDLAVGIDLDAAVQAKAREVFSRGWRDKPAEVAR
jgi:hypothetical protein